MFTCSQCPTSFKNKTLLKVHLVKHLIGIKIDFFLFRFRLITCSPVCNVPSPSRTKPRWKNTWSSISLGSVFDFFSLQVHVDHMFTCSQCPTSFKNKTSLKEHMVKHLIGLKNWLFSLQVHVDHVFTCSQCPTSFKNKTSLKEHVAKHHIVLKILKLTFFSSGSCGSHVHLFAMSHLLQE